MTQTEQIEISLNKNKLMVILLFSIFFIGNGIWFLINPPLNSTPILGTPTFIFIIGLTSILLFGFIAITTYKTISDNNGGLIIDQQGVTDTSSSFSAGFIPWTDIQEIKVTECMSIKSLIFIVKNPHDHLTKVTSPLNKMNMEMYYKIYGTPLVIPTLALDTNFYNLFLLLTEKLRIYKS